MFCYVKMIRTLANVRFGTFHLSQTKIQTNNIIYLLSIANKDKI